MRAWAGGRIGERATVATARRQAIRPGLEHPCIPFRRWGDFDQKASGDSPPKDEKPKEVSGAPAHTLHNMQHIGP